MLQIRQQPKPMDLIPLEGKSLRIMLHDCDTNYTNNATQDLIIV